VISIPTGGTNVDFAGSIDVANVGISTGVIDLKNSGSQSVVKFYCESSNAHYAEIKAPAHGLFSGNVTLTLPATTDTIAGIAATQTFTNKTLTSPVLNTGSVGTSLAFPDNAKALFGAGSDLQIFHNGSDSFVKDNGDGILFLQGSNAVKIIGNTASAAILDANEGGGVHLYHNGSEKIASTANGISVTGNVIATGTVEPAGDTAAGDNAAIGYTAAEGLILTGQGSTSDITLKNDADATVFTVPTGTDDILFPDNAKAMFGAGSDLQIYHNGLASYISEQGTGNLVLGAADSIIFQNAAHDENMLVASQNGAVSLYYDNAIKMATTSGGAHVTGALSATTSMTVQNGSGTEGVRLDYNENGGEIVLLGTSGNNKLLIDYLDNDDDGNGLGRILNLGAGSTGVQLGVANASNTGGITFITGNSVARQHINAIGDIFLYKTDGSTVGVHWDASESDLNVTGDIKSNTAAVKVAGKESIYVPAAAMYPSTTNPCSDLTQVETTALRPDLKVLDFAAAADDFAQFTIAFPKSWNEGTITFQPFWTVTGTDSGTVAWQLAGVAITSDESINTAFGTQVATTALAFSTTSNDLMVSAESGAVTIAGSPAANDMCFFQINRDTSADSQTGAARLIGIKLFFTTDAANDA